MMAEDFPQSKMHRRGKVGASDLWLADVPKCWRASGWRGAEMEQKVIETLAHLYMQARGK